ncbi:N-acetylmuramoyl-L-alanine amidase [Actinomycetes bacterium M1A6_2h]
MHRRPKPSLILGAVAALAVTGPIAVYTALGTSSDVQKTNESTTAIPTTIAKIALASAPDITISLKDLTGLNLPDLNIGNLRDLKLPDTINVPTIPGLTPPSTPSAQAPVPAAPLDSITVPAGAVVKEVSQDTPFSMVALTTDKIDDAVAQVRAQLPDGSWGPWNATTAIDTGSSDASGSDTPATVGTEPIFVGLTKAVQFLLTPKAAPTDPAAAPAAPVVPPVPAAPAPAEPTVPPVPADTQPLGYVPASSSSPLRTQDEPLIDTLAQVAAAATAVLITPGTSETDGALAESAPPVAGNGPTVITRAQWGADESKRCSTPTIDDSLGGATIHHTAGSNDYTKDESAGIVRAIYAYHSQTLGWCDIGYNALVDKYGQIFEGRAGGLDKNVEGAHAGGFNENTMGLALMGDYSTEKPSEAMLDAAGKFLGWRLGLAGLNPKGQTTMTSEGTRYTPYAKGQTVDLPIIFAHRDVGNTECPGDAAYSDLPQLRDIAEANLNGAAAPAAPAAPAESAAPADPAAPVDPAPAAPVETAPSAPAEPAPAGPPAETLASGAAPGAGVPALIDELVRLTDPNPVAAKWSSMGGEQGALGPAVTGVMPAAEGAQRANFLNGTVVANPSGQAFSVIGEIFKQFVKMGGDGGSMGLPTSDEFKIPGGWQSNFEKGSLIFDEVTGIVTTVLKAYNDTYTEKMNTAPTG